MVIGRKKYIIRSKPDISHIFKRFSHLEHLFTIKCIKLWTKTARDCFFSGSQNLYSSEWIPRLSKSLMAESREQEILQEEVPPSRLQLATNFSIFDCATTLQEEDSRIINLKFSNGKINGNIAEEQLSKKQLRARKLFTSCVTRWAVLLPNFRVWRWWLLAGWPISIQLRANNLKVLEDVAFLGGHLVCD